MHSFVWACVHTLISFDVLFSVILVTLHSRKEGQDYVSILTVSCILQYNSSTCTVRFTMAKT